MLVLAVMSVLARGARRTRLRRTALVAEPLRPFLLMLASGDPDDAAEAIDTLRALPPREWAAIEESVLGLLLKVRGEAHGSVVHLLDVRGDLERAHLHLHSRQVSRRARAAVLLGAAHDHSAVPLLVERVHDPHPDVASCAVRALGRIGDPAAAPALFAAVSHRVPPRTVATALHSLRWHDHQLLIDELDQPEVLSRAIAAEVAGLLTAVTCVPVLTRILCDDDENLEVRVRAARALGRCGLPSSLVPLQRATGPDQPSALRVVAARAINEVAGPSAVPHLVRLLEDSHPRVVEYACSALLASGPDGMQALIHAATDPSAGHGHDAARYALAAAQPRRSVPRELEAAPPVTAPAPDQASRAGEHVMAGGEW